MFNVHNDNKLNNEITFINPNSSYVVDKYSKNMRKINLNNHNDNNNNNSNKRRKLNESSIKHKCKHCPKVFTNKQNRNRHQKST